ncbi:hypothetical protein [Thomasclavelia cocleata]|uniref:hypothetical protein n=1 Tax=Thomasclavelia cocleata TaxID=69824 RepID=UPI00272ED376|nr:hypothetical protein [Thomasclavelia cocleata]
MKNLIENVKIELLGLGTVSHDIVLKYRFLAQKFLNIPVDSGQIFDIEEFIEQYDAGKMNAPLNLSLVSREKEIQNLKEKIFINDLIIVSGASGVGKTKLVVEVCKQIRNKCDIEVFCVKNNGQLLYNDIRETISDSGSYLIFFDDANYTMNLESIFEFCISKNIDSEINIKFVMTVRDYAKDSIKKLALNKVKFEEIELKPLPFEDIKEIIKKELEVKNEYYLKQIVKIAQGNVRLAVLAAVAAKERGYLAINNALDIFRNFYMPIFEENKINDSEIIVLFAISVFGPVMLNSHEGINYILNNNNISETEYIEICHRLNECELIEMYENSVIKIADQSFSNYILAYIFIEKRRLSIKDILLNLFPKYYSEIIYSINTLLQLFYSNTVLEYIGREINAAWCECNPCDEIEYVKAFRAFNEDKALLYAKRIIDETGTVLCVLDTDDFLQSVDNNIYEKDDIVQILTQFGESSQYNMAIDLLVEYFSKRPDIGNEICYGIAERMGINSNFDNITFKNQKYLISMLYEKYEKSHNTNYGILLICIIKKFLRYEYHETEQGMSPNTVTIITYHLNYSNELMEYRKMLLYFLKKLREEKHLCDNVDKVIANLHANGNEETKKIFYEDVLLLHRLFDEEKNIPDFDLCVVFAELVNQLMRLEFDSEEIEVFLNQNEEYIIYKSLSREYIKGESRKKEEQKRKEIIAQLIKNYEYDEFVYLFNVCKNRECKNIENTWYIQQSLEIIFDLIKEKTKQYLFVVEAYFECGTPFMYSLNNKVNDMLQIITTDDLENLIDKLNLDKKNKWKVSFYEEFPEEKITIKIVGDLIEFISNQREFKFIQIPRVRYMIKYKNKGVDIVKSITDFLLKIGENKPYVIADFFGRLFDENEVENILSFFDEDMESLMKLYLLGMENEHFDYNGELVLRLILIDINFWKEITKKIEINYKSTIDSEVFDKIWTMDNYTELINMAYENAKSSYFGKLSYEVIIHMFASSDKELDFIAKRKESWIKDRIIKYFNDEQEMINLFDVISTSFSGKRI